ncbi:PspA-associated protein PspAA [Flindersiella endophytica]
MIVRILGEGQLKVADEHLGELNKLDSALESAINAGDESSFRTALTELLDKVRAVGTKLPDDSLEDSDLFLPPSDATVDEVKDLLGDEGLIPG